MHPERRLARQPGLLAQGHDQEGARSARTPTRTATQNGFFLQVEGASIDKQDHAGNACGQIGETDDFDQAIAYAMQTVDLSEHARDRHRRPRAHLPDPQRPAGLRAVHRAEDR